MSVTIYRKYRPQGFQEVIGQDYIKKTLENEIKTDSIAHAYIFSGPRGIGKTTLARIFAKAINCETRKIGESEPCNQCSSCLEIIKNKSLDLIEIDAASNRGINEIRELKERTRFTPAKSKYKVFIIDEVHMLTIEAFNALLKILEEPPGYIIFILATTEIHKVPETIISRCQRFDFKRVNLKEIVKRLEMIIKKEGIKADKEVLKNIAYHSEGHPRDAESFLAQVLALTTEDKKIGLEQLKLILPTSNFNLILQLIEYLLAKKTKESFVLINSLIEEGIDLHHFLTDFIEVLRKILLIKANLNNLTFKMEDSIEKKVKALADEIETQRLVQMIHIFIATKREIDYFTIPQLAIEMAVLKICESTNSSSQVFPDQGQVSDCPKVREKPPVLYKANKTENVPDVDPKPVVVKEKEKIQEETENQFNGSTDISVEPLKIEVESPKKRNINTIQGCQTISFGIIKEKWGEFLTKVEETNYSLATLVRIAKPVSLQDNTLNLSLPYKFHLERIRDNKNRIIIEDILKEILQQDIKINSILKEQEKMEDSQEGRKTISNLLETFGGEVVE